MATTAKSKSKAKAAALSDQEIQQSYIKYQNELQALAGKIGELESEADEFRLVLKTLLEVLGENPDRKCFRLIGDILVELTVKEVVPSLQTNLDGITKVIVSLAEQYKTKETELDSFKEEYGIRPI